MWIFTKHGFYSAVCAREGDGSRHQPVDRDTIMVRARKIEHLDALKTRFPDLLGRAVIQESHATDYAFRIFVDASVWSRILAALGDDVDYDNFKSEVSRHGNEPDRDYEHALHEVWSVMRRLQR